MAIFKASLIAHALARDQRVERLARYQFHGNEVDAVETVDLVDGDDVGMTQRRGGLSLMDQAASAFRVRGKLSRQDFDRGKPSQTRIAGPVHHAHAAFTQRRQDLVVAERMAQQRRRGVLLQSRRWNGTRGSAQKVPAAIMRFEQRLHFLAQRFVVPADLPHKSETFPSLVLEGLVTESGQYVANVQESSKAVVRVS